MTKKKIKDDFLIGIAIGLIFFLGSALKGAIELIILEDYSFKSWAAPTASALVGVIIFVLFIWYGIKKSQ